MVVGVSISGSQAAPHCLMASMATCCHFSRLCVLAFVVEMRHHAFGQQRHDAVRAQFHGFLDDGFDDFSLGHGLQQRDGAGRGRNEIFLLTRSVTASREALGNLAKEFMARAVQNDNRSRRVSRAARAAHGAPRVRQAGGRRRCSCSGGR